MLNMLVYEDRLDFIVINKSTTLIYILGRCSMNFKRWISYSCAVSVKLTFR